MFCPIVSKTAPVTLIGGGEATPYLVNLALSHAPTCVAADGGAAVALAADAVPEAVIGDFDSLDDATRAAIPSDRLFPNADQNSTDFQKCLAAIDAPLILGVGFLGRRLDHTLANLSALLGEARPVILLSLEEICYITPAEHALDLPEGTPIGFYPLRSATLSTQGVKYPLHAAQVAPDGLISTSNHALGPVGVRVDRAAVLITLPLAALPLVIAQLVRAK